MGTNRRWSVIEAFGVTQGLGAGTDLRVTESGGNQGRITATCMLITASNLLRGERRHGFLENVVTHPEFRGRRHSSAIVRFALDSA